MDPDAWSILLCCCAVGYFSTWQIFSLGSCLHETFSLCSRVFLPDSFSPVAVQQEFPPDTFRSISWSREPRGNLWSFQVLYLTFFYPGPKGKKAFSMLSKRNWDEVFMWFARLLCCQVFSSDTLLCYQVFLLCCAVGYFYLTVLALLLCCLEFPPDTFRSISCPREPRGNLWLFQILYLTLTGSKKSRGRWTFYD